MIEEDNRSLFCRIFHSVSQISDWKFSTLPIILFLAAKYQNSVDGIDTNNDTLSIPQNISIHSSQYILKSCILRHIGTEGVDYSVLLFDGTVWHHQLDHLGKIIHDIDTILSNNQDIEYLLYEKRD